MSRPVWTWSLRDLRWKLAFWTWCPAARVEERIHAHQQAQLPAGHTPADRLLLFVLEDRLPLRYRILRRVMVNPLARLSDRICPGWSEDKRALLSYWRHP